MKGVQRIIILEIKIIEIIEIATNMMEKFFTVHIVRQQILEFVDAQNFIKLSD
jgi:hypothetical protein